MADLRRPARRIARPSFGVPLLLAVAVADRGAVAPRPPERLLGAPGGVAIAHLLPGARYTRLPSARPGWTKIDYRGTVGWIEVVDEVLLTQG